MVAPMPEPTDRILFEVDGAAQTFRVARLSGREALSELYQFELVVTCEDPAVSPSDLLGRAALVTFAADDDNDRHVHGVVSRFELGDFGKKLVSCHVTVVPRQWRLLHRANSRIFQDKNAVAIVQKVLEDAGLTEHDDFRLAVQGRFRTREYCVQYRESDWAFISRLLEDEGVFYFFEHTAEKHVLVLADRAAAHTSIGGNATIPFRQDLGALASREHVARFRYSEQVRAGKVTVRDYEFKRPDLLLEGEAAAAVGADLEVYDHPAAFFEPSDGAARARIRLEQQQAARALGRGTSGCVRLVPGSRFSLAEHPRASFNREYLLVSVEHDASEPVMAEAAGGEAHYENSFEVIPADVPFRCPEVTPRPVVRGLQSATVVGPAGEEIHTDEHGRVKVQFFWDRIGRKNDQSSCWLRVAQASAGPGWGAMFIPRVKHEVLVGFLEGDPDRPIVVGSVYHGANPTPYALPANKTRSALRSATSPGGAGSNELRFEDKKGNEEVFLQAQKDWTIAILNDKNQTIDHDETLTVKNDRSVSVGHDQAASIERDETLSIGRSRHKSVSKDESESIGENRTVDVGKDHTESIGGNFALSVTKGASSDVGEDVSETVGKSKTVTIGADLKVEVKADAKAKVGGSAQCTVELDAAVKAGSRVVVECGDATITIDQGGKVAVSAKSLELKSSGPLKLDGQDIAVTSSGNVKIEASGPVEVKGSGPMNLDASGPVKVRGANVGIN